MKTRKKEKTKKESEKRKMKIKVMGVSKELKSGVSKKTGKPFSGYFVSYAYKRDDINGAQAESLFLSQDMVNDSKYIPQPGDLCELYYGRGGFIESIKFISKGELT